MKRTPKITDREFVRRSTKLMDFMEEHPDLGDPLALWMADRSTCETMYPEAAEIFKREMDEF